MTTGITLCIRIRIEKDEPSCLSVVEPLGSETLVSVDIEGHELTGIAKGRAEPAAGSVAQFAFNIENLHLFDQESGAAIR